MELTVYSLLTCLGSGALLYQGVQAARCRSEALNSLVAALAAVCAVAGVVAFALHLGHPTLLFNAFGNAASGITLLLYAAALFVAVAVAFAVMAFRSEDGSVPAWFGAAAAVAAVLFALGGAFGYLTITEGFKITRLDGGSVALTCYFVTAALVLGAFLVMAVAGVRKERDALLLVRRCAAVAVVLNVLSAVAYLVWFSLDLNAAAQVTKTTFDIQAGSFLVGGAVDTATAADKLALIFSGSSAPLFWGGFVACGLVLPVACGVLAWPRDAFKPLAGLGAAGVLAAGVGVCCFVSCLGVLG